MNSDDIGEPSSQINAVRLPPMAALRCFEAAARLESFSRAADALHLTHGAISRAVRLVEDELGVDSQRGAGICEMRSFDPAFSNLTWMIARWRQDDDDTR